MSDQTEKQSGRLSPAHILDEDYFRPLNISEQQFADQLKLSLQVVQDVLWDRVPIDAVIALRLARYFSTTPEFWLNLRTTCEIHAARRNKVLMEQIETIVPNPDAQERAAQFQVT